jgi:hypothetical protein
VQMFDHGDDDEIIPPTEKVVNMSLAPGEAESGSVYLMLIWM